MELLRDSSWVTTRSHLKYSYAVVRRRADDLEEEVYSIWAARVRSNKSKGVKVLKTCARLHVAMNHVAQAPNLKVNEF